MVKRLHWTTGILGTIAGMLCPSPGVLVAQFSQPTGQPSEQAVLSNPLPTPSPIAAQPLASNGATWIGVLDPRIPLPTPNPLSSPDLAQSDIPAADHDRFRQIMDYATRQALHQRSMGEIMQTIAEQLLGSTYAANLLDRTSQETLVVSLTKFDCVLFIETVLALSRSIAVQNYSYTTFTKHLRQQRYRNGELNGYCSRLHYFSEWIADNQQRGIVQDQAPRLGGLPLDKVLNFMSSHRSNYPPLLNDATYACIQTTEHRLKQQTVTYIPQSQIRSLYARLQPGDIVAIATELAGLDVTHTGLVYRNSDGSLGLIHASPSGAVTIAPDLATYVERVQDQRGILLARPVDPRQRSDEAMK